MKTIKLWVLCGLVCGPVLAEETVPEKVEAGAKDVGRSVKKAGNRVSEAVCAKSDVECAARKAGNRVGETKDKAVDKTSEVKNKVD